VVAVIVKTVALPSSSPQQTAAPKEQADVGAMITELEAKLKTNPDDANGWKMLGWSFFETGRFAESARAYARATQLEPKNAEHFSSLGEALVLAGKGDVPADAKKAFETALQLDPGDPRSRYFLAVAKDIGGDHKGAIDDWLALLKDTPPGAPWEADVRRIITEVGAKEKIEVASRLAAIKPAAPAGGAAIAVAPIPGPTTQQMRDASSMPSGQQEAMVRGMVDGLEAKLKANPDNERGWIMLMRSRLQQGETVKANAALTGARAAFAGKADALKRINEAAAELGVKG
jgi:cytochrome c-type biogenesis protein CcmH